jgi:hypothetical protein
VSEGEASAHEARMSTHENAHWTIDDKTFLINILSLKATNTITFNNIFKDAVIKEVAEALKGHHPCVKGGKKKDHGIMQVKVVKGIYFFVYILPLF